MPESRRQKTSEAPAKSAAAMTNEELRERIKQLEDAVSRVAVLAGHGNVLKEYNIERWVPGKKDMRKYN